MASKDPEISFDMDTEKFVYSPGSTHSYSQQVPSFLRRTCPSPQNGGKQGINLQFVGQLSAPHSQILQGLFGDTCLSPGVHTKYRFMISVRQKELQFILSRVLAAKAPPPPPPSNERVVFDGDEAQGKNAVNKMWTKVTKIIRTLGWITHCSVMVICSQ